MPSPDLTPYVDLRVYDRDPQDIFDSAITSLQVALPNWVPREGNTEVLLLEALAQQVAEAAYAINRLPDGVVEVVLQLYGIERSVGVAPTAQVRFATVAAQGYVVPAGTAVRLPAAASATLVTFTTDTDLAVPSGSFTGVVAATGDSFTSAANGQPAGLVLDVLDSLLYVESATLAADVTGGVDPEDDDMYLTRGTQRFGRLSETLVLPAHFVSAALEESYVVRAYAVDNYDPGQAGAPGSAPGHLTLAVYGEGAPVSAAQRQELLDKLRPLTFGPLTVHIIDPVVTVQDVAVTVRRSPSFSDADVVTSVNVALGTLLSTGTWGWANSVRRNDIISVVGAADGVDYVVAVTTPAADVALPGAANLVRAGAITVSVQS